MHRPHHLVRIRHAGDQLLDRLGELAGQVVTDGIRHVDRRGTGLDDLLEDAAQEIQFGASCVLGRKLDVVGVVTRPADRLHGLLDDLIGRHAQLFLHVDRAGSDECMDATGSCRPDGLAGTADVVLVGTRQRTDGRVLDRLGDGVDRIEITGGSSGKAGLDHVDLHALELPGNADLLFLGHRGAGALLAVAQGGIENYQTVFHA